MKVLKLVGWILFCELVGGSGAIFTYSAIPNWYTTLNKPVFSPPNYLFAPVWTILYALMGTALFLVLESKSKQKKLAATIFFIQLILNFLWSFIFFGQKNISLAFAEIILLLILIISNSIIFAKIDKRAGLLLIPYIIWVSFASLLNYSLMSLN